MYFDYLINDKTNYYPMYESSTFDNLKKIINSFDSLSEESMNSKITIESKHKDKKPKKANSLEVKKIIFNNPATIVFWADGTKTVVKASSCDEFSPYYGFCCAVTKKIFGNNSKLKKIINKYSAYDNFKL